MLPHDRMGFRIASQTLIHYSAPVSDAPEFPSRKLPARQPWLSKGNQSVIVFVTVCSHDREEVFANPEIHDLLVQKWHEADSWIVGKYVILPDHIHLFAAPNGESSSEIRRWVKFWKSQVSKGWPRSREHTVWQRDMWDRQLRSGDSYAQKWKYVRDNPVRHGLVEHADDWPFQGELNPLAWHEE